MGVCSAGEMMAKKLCLIHKASFFLFTFHYLSALRSFSGLSVVLLNLNLLFLNSEFRSIKSEFRGEKTKQKRNFDQCSFTNIVNMNWEHGNNFSLVSFMLKNKLSYI